MSGTLSRELIERGWHQRKWRWRIGLLGGLLAGLFITIYAFWGGRDIFMGAELSYNHVQLKNRCGNCHSPFAGVKDQSCLYPCHAGDKPTAPSYIPYPNDIHSYKKKFNKQECFSCHPPKCHSVNSKQKDEIAALLASDIPCEPKIIEDITLPNPFDEKSCAACHDKGCTRSINCRDCHVEHDEGMGISINKPEEVYPAKLVFTEDLLEAMDSEHNIPILEIRRALPLGKISEKGYDQARRIYLLTDGMPENGCLACHAGILSRPEPTFEKTMQSRVTRTIFEHNIEGHIKYKCKKCHLNPFPLERDKDEAIFSMEACGKKCHYRDDCSGCHNFHDEIGNPGDRVDIPVRLRQWREENKNATAEVPVITEEETATEEESDK